MACPQENSSRFSGMDVWMTLAAIAGALLLSFAAMQAEAQTYTVLHTFTGHGDGAGPTSTLLIDRAGNLYGTTTGGPADGVVFQLKRSGSGWILNNLYTFTGTNGGGAFPVNNGGLVFGPDGAIYGTTVEGGINNQGTVFRLRPSPNRCQSFSCPWSNTVLYRFTGYPNDGAQPTGGVVFDAAGNIYAAASEPSAQGPISQLTPANGGWTESVIPTVEIGPIAGALTTDSSGNLYGASRYGGLAQKGAVFQLVPSGSGWTEHILYSFAGGSDGEFPVGGVVLDSAGNIYGSSSFGGSGNGGTIFQLSPGSGGWTFNLLCSFGGSMGPQSSLTIDAAGNLYGTTQYDGRYGGGSAFKVSNSGAGWTCTDLHDFQSGNGGVGPVGGLTLDASGNIFGTTETGGANQGGVVFEITP